MLGDDEVGRDFREKGLCRGVKAIAWLGGELVNKRRDRLKLLLIKATLGESLEPFVSKVIEVARDDFLRIDDSLALLHAVQLQ